MGDILFGSEREDDRVTVYAPLDVEAGVNYEVHRIWCPEVATCRC